MIMNKEYKGELFFVDTHRICDECGKNHSVENMELCPECYVKRRRELYQKSWETKWKDYENMSFDAMGKCVFCRDANLRYKKMEVHMLPNKCPGYSTLPVSVSGDPCAPFCLIEKDICGSKDAFLDNLEDRGESQNDEGEWFEQYDPEQIKQIALTIKQRGDVE